jgi:hypothetical protein
VLALDSAGDYVQSKSTYAVGTTAMRAKVYSGLPSDYFTVIGYGGYLAGGDWDYMNRDGAYLWFEFGGLGDYLRCFISGSYVNYGYTPYPTNQWHTYDVVVAPSRNLM